MEFTVEKIIKGKNPIRQTTWTREDITNQVIMPINDVQRQDLALDTSNLTLINSDSRALKPFERIIIRIKKAENKIENLYRVVMSDDVQLSNYGENKLYTHNLSLIESTKILERFIVDNMTITNLLAFLYDDTPDWVVSTNFPTTKVTKLDGDLSIANHYYTENNNVYLTDYYTDSVLDITTPYTVLIKGTAPTTTFEAQEAKGIYGAEDSVSMKLPNGHTINMCDSTGHILQEYYNYTFSQEGYYELSKKYVGRRASLGVLVEEIYVTVTWKFSVKVRPTVAPKKPTKYTIRQVLNKLLRRIGKLSTAIRTDENQLFELDPSLDFLDQEFSPEFTFTQNTLFGILEQVGTYIHAIPRLIPKDSTRDWENWSLITFDFLGKRDQVNDMSDYELVTHNNNYDGNNYTSAFLCDIQNSFQTNNVEFISLVEPYEGGYISVRTEDSNFEVSNNNACIKTSRPIQRIVSLTVAVENTNNAIRELDISKYVKEVTDYNILADYAENSQVLSARGSKSSAIYYTRGSNVISGLTYYPPREFGIQYLSENRAIENIINLAGGYNLATKRWTIKNLMFRIKYVPYYNFKAMQFKPVLGEDCGENMLFYNQQDSQQVDIESLGENIRGALMMTANEELSLTGYINGDPLKKEVRSGDRVFGNYYAYQINREFINKNEIKTTVELSKDFNKWNEMIAIKKNYREWEISNRESYTTNPVYNEFCLIDDKFDIDKYIEELQPTYNQQEIRTQLEIFFGDLGEGFSGKGIDVIEQSFKGEEINIPLRWACCNVHTNEKDALGNNKVFKFIIPCACFSFGNSIVVNFSAADNYAAGTYVEDSQTNAAYGLENYVKYCDKYGKANYMEVYIGIGKGLHEVKYGSIITTQEIEGYKDNLIASKLMYQSNVPNAFEDGYELDRNTNTYSIDYFRKPFVIDKDSRQVLGMTIQLNLNSTNENIWVYPELARRQPFIAKQPAKTVEIYGFTKTPNRLKGNFDNATLINSELLIEDIPSNGYYNFATYPASKKMSFVTGQNATVSDADYVGIGIAFNIDNTKELVLYYNKEIKKGDTLNPLYIMMRRYV